MKHPTGTRLSEKQTYKQKGHYMESHRDFDKHFFYIYQSYGISVADIINFPEGITHILIIETKKDRGTKYYYVTELEDWKKTKKEYLQKLDDGTLDPQKHISLRDMKLYKSWDEVPELNEVKK